MYEPARVLIVDDNEHVLHRASTVLSPECQVIGVAKDGPGAIEAVEALRPDVVVLDLSLPGMTGFELTAELRKIGSKAAVVFLTLQGEEDVALAAIAAGVAGYVVTPRLGSDLPLAVRDACAGRTFVSKIH